MFNLTKTTIVALAILTASITAANAQATPATAATTGMNIAVVDTQKIFEKATALQKIKEQLDKKAEEFKKESAKKEDYFKKKFEDLEKQKATLAKDAYDKKSEEIGKEFGDAQKKVQDNRQVIDKAYTDAMQQVNDSFTAIISEEATKKGYKVVLPKLQTLFSDTGIEITDSMIEALNKKLPSVTVKFDAPAKG
jgi:outer membrane protein